MRKADQRGFTLIEMLIVAAIGVFILEAAYLLYSGSLKLFKDVKTTADNIQTRVPTVELVARYFDRWGVGVYTVSTGDCSAYPPSNQKCITVTTGTPCDEVTFWGDLYGTGFVQSVSGSTASLASCRLSTTTDQNCHYLWRNDVLQNDIISGTSTVNHLKLNSNLSSIDADCSGLSSTSPTNATVTSSLVPWIISGYVTKTVQAGDIIQRAPHKVRLYCAQNSNDSNQNWLYVDLTDTAGSCSSDESSSPIAPVDSFQVQLLPSSCDGTAGGCRSARITMTIRSQDKNYGRAYGTQSVDRVFGR